VAPEAVIAAERADSADAAPPINELEAELAQHYPAESRHGYSVEKLLREGVAFFASQAGVRRLRLETGIQQSAAIRLYEASGFRRRAAFPPYRHDPLSLYYEKSL
jgi:putative acetyltransferase